VATGGEDMCVGGECRGDFGVGGGGGGGWGVGWGGGGGLTVS